MEVHLRYYIFQGNIIRVVYLTISTASWFISLFTKKEHIVKDTGTMPLLLFDVSTWQGRQKLQKTMNQDIKSGILKFDGVVLEIYLDHRFQWPQECLKCESLTYEVVT